jgi:hypothetical protein
MYQSICKILCYNPKHHNHEKLCDRLGEEGQKLSRETLKLLKKRKFKQFWDVEALSYDPRN